MILMHNDENRTWVMQPLRSVILLLLTITILLTSSTHAQTAADDLQTKINQRTSDIQALEKEIAGYQKQINSLGSQADSLSNTLKSLDLTQKKLAADIQLTQNKIAAKNLEIQQLSSQISSKETNITADMHIISRSLALMNENASKSIPEILLSSQSIAKVLGSVDELSNLQNSLVDKINDLRTVKAGLETNKMATMKARADLVSLNKQLSDQRQVVLNTQAEKNQLLRDTKQSQSEYRKILAQKQALKDAYEQEILAYQAQLHLNVDLSKLPHTGSGVLTWPLDSIVITQYFGNTPFATANPQIYNGKGHTGVDFRASIGTAVKAALSGIVSGVGNTDIVPGCYSYGRWVMIKHPNGLSTLYAHLSLPSVSVGESVSTDQLIGYSGNTGYTTGPHLHFGVYATQGVQIRTLTSAQSVHCAGATLPLADFQAYLNPLSYL